MKSSTLKNSLLSCPVAATLKTDSAAPTVLANHTTMLLAVSWEICHSSGSTGTLQNRFIIIKQETIQLQVHSWNGTPVYPTFYIEQQKNEHTEMYWWTLINSILVSKHLIKGATSHDCKIAMNVKIQLFMKYLSVHSTLQSCTRNFME